MRPLSLSSIFLLALPLLALAAPAAHVSPDAGLTTGTRDLPAARREAAVAAVVTPPPCVPKTPEPSEDASRVVFDTFIEAFLVRKNLTEAFAYVDAGYINHSSGATANGPGAALDALGPIWPHVQIKVLSSQYGGKQGSVRYQITGLDGPGTTTITDTYRLSGGCIVEHWDRTG